MPRVFGAEAAAVSETFLTPARPEDEIDSVATWRGAKGQHWLFASAKDVDNLAVFDGEQLELRLAGAPVMREGVQVGVVTQAMYSPLNDWTVAIARLPVDCANEGTKLVVNCAENGPIAATTGAMPFFDPEKKRRTAKG